MIKQVLILASLMGVMSTYSAALENIALGKPYKFNIAPNYSLCKDDADAVQLTDGEYRKPTDNGFWTYKTTVGWTLGGPGDRMVTVDLGKDEPLKGFSWNFGAGRAGVHWPDLIFIYVSTDGKQWRFAGDLYSHSKSENDPPKEDGFGIYRAWSENMPSHGRYVMFLVRAAGFIFVDEVEVYRGTADMMSAGEGAALIDNPQQHYADYRKFRTFFSDAERIGRAAQELEESERAEVVAQLNKVNAILLRNKGGARPYMWTCDRWASADPLDVPTDKSVINKALEVVMMRGETRSEAVNISNPTDKDIEITVEAKGFPTDANVQLREVLPTVVKSGARVGGALMGEGSSKTTLKVAAGTTRQIWISFVKPSCRAGEYQGKIVAGGIEKSLTLKLSKITFPERPRLHVGGWDYTERDGRMFGSAENLQSRLARMREMFTDTPWAGNGVMPTGAKFNAEGALITKEKLNFSVWKDWVELWGDQARQYCVFANVKGEFHGEKMGTARFNRMVGEYMRAWYDGIKDGLKGRRVILLLLDEPFRVEQDEIIIAWAKALKATTPEFVIFEDTDHSQPDKADRQLYPVCDIICPPLPEVTAKQSFDYFIKQRRECGKELWFYSCCGPSRTFDPIVYYRAQAWNAWKCGAKGSMFWAFGCGGGIGDSFHPFDQTGTEYSPFFVSPTNAYRAKQSEAVMEGVEDYEYMAMLTDRAVALKRAGKNVSALKKIIAEAPEKALPKEEWLKGNTYSFGVGAKRFDWFLPRDHESMDKVRIEILRALEATEK